MGGLGPRAAIGPLTGALADDIVPVRRAAARALGRWAARRHARAILTSALDDPDPGVRAEARWALPRPR